MRLVLLALTLATLAAPALAAPATGAGPPPPGAPPASAGQALFAEKCGMCHRARGMGTFLLTRRMGAAEAQLEARAELPAEFVVQAVRGGIGNMPPIPRGEVSDRQLAQIAAYLARKPAP